MKGNKIFKIILYTEMSACTLFIRTICLKPKFKIWNRNANLIFFWHQ